MDLLRVAELERRLGYRFREPRLLEQALTHASYANEHPPAAEHARLAFLGDAALALVVADRVMAGDASAPVGALTSQRAELVAEARLARWAADLELSALRVWAAARTSRAGARATRSWPPRSRPSSARSMRRAASKPCATRWGFWPRGSLKHALVADPARARRLPPPPPPDEMLVIEDRLRRNVEDVLSIRDRQIRGGIVVFRGDLTTEPARALDLLIGALPPVRLHAVSARGGGGRRRPGLAGGRTRRRAGGSA